MLKGDDRLKPDQRRQIFHEEMKKNYKEQKIQKALTRDRKVEELKKSLKIENDLTTVLVATRPSADVHLKAESHANREIFVFEKINII